MKSNQSRIKLPYKPVRIYIIRLLDYSPGKWSLNKMQIFEELHHAKSAEPTEAFCCKHLLSSLPCINSECVHAVQLGFICLPHQFSK